MSSVDPSVPHRIVVAPVVERIIPLDLPALPRDRLAAAVGFTCRRIATLPGLLRAGVLAVAVLHRSLLAVGGERALAALTAHPLPIIGEYPRLVRSLALAYVWETWPGTRPDGAPSPEA